MGRGEGVEVRGVVRLDEGHDGAERDGNETDVLPRNVLQAQESTDDPATGGNMR